MLCNEFIRSYAVMRAANDLVWTDATMKLAAYSVMATALAVVMAECGHLIYHLSLMVW